MTSALSDFSAVETSLSYNITERSYAVHIWPKIDMRQVCTAGQTKFDISEFLQLKAAAAADGGSCGKLIVKISFYINQLNQRKWNTEFYAGDSLVNISKVRQHFFGKESKQPRI